MKRSRGPAGSGATPKRPAPAAVGHWSHGLLQSMRDPEVIVQSDEKVVMIRDKYPKARHHYLIMPEEEIPSLKHLRPSHIPLLQHMLSTARDYVSQLDEPKPEFRYGFHAIPSMQRLHMHVISTDMDSVCLKHKKHWNSFTTEFFMDAESIVTSLEETGRVKLLDKAVCDELMKRPLQCHVCHQGQVNLPKLKSHIKQHFP